MKCVDKMSEGAEEGGLAIERAHDIQQHTDQACGQAGPSDELALFSLPLCMLSSNMADSIFVAI